MRYYNPVSDPNKPVSRSRTTVHSPLTPAPSQFGQRPMFSEPGENQPPPVQGMMGTESRLDPVIPTDEREGSESRTTLEIPNPRAGVMMTYSMNNVANPPTAAELDAAFGPKPSGWVGFAIDGGGAGVVWLIVRSTSNTWYHQKFTKAV